MSPSVNATCLGVKTALSSGQRQRRKDVFLIRTVPVVECVFLKLQTLLGVRE